MNCARVALLGELAQDAQGSGVIAFLIGGVTGVGIRLGWLEDETRNRMPDRLLIDAEQETHSEHEDRNRPDQRGTQASPPHRELLASPERPLQHSDLLGQLRLFAGLAVECKSLQHRHGRTFLMVRKNRK